MVLFPELFRSMDMFLQTAFGAAQQAESGSLTVTTALQVLELPLPSLTVKVTLFGPVSEQLKDVLEAEKLVAQLSELPLFSWLALMVLLPELFRSMEMFLQPAVGMVTSLTVTTEVHSSVWLLPSVTVRVTLLLPTFEQLKLVLEADS